MRIIRIPYIYLSDRQLKGINIYSFQSLKIIYDIHHDIPNMYHSQLMARAYQYYPGFLVWAHITASIELLKRKCHVWKDLPSKFYQLKTRDISAFLPPNDNEISKDVVFLLEQWKAPWYHHGGIKLPLSYIKLAQRLHGYSPEQSSLQRVDTIPGVDYNSDRGWYRIQSKAKA